MDNKIYYVYIHTCPNSKRYVGITTLPPYKRWRRGEGYKSNDHFYSAIKKYGWGNIEHKLIRVDTEELMKFWEKMLIYHYKSNNSDYGYNKSTGGEQSPIGCKFTEEHRRKLSEAKKGRKLSEEHCKKLSQVHKGKKLSEETKKKLSESKKGELNPMYGKPPWNKGLRLNNEINKFEYIK